MAHSIGLATNELAVQAAGAPGVQWYALWTRSRHEHVVREQLDRKRIEVFLPTVARWSRWKDRK
jgi:hypothetical protein